jgi:FMN reductase [NAD(P)H]
MINEKKVMEAIERDPAPSSILCIGYPQEILQPEPKRNLIELIHEV